MQPTAGATEDGNYYLSWNPPGLTLDIQFTRGGRVSWFFADDTTGAVDGSEEEEENLPPKVFSLLRLFRRK